MFHIIIFVEKKYMMKVFAYFIIYSLLGMPLIIYNMREIFDPLVVLSLDVSKYLDEAKHN